jgi:predicted HAD superfamily Cof-like phosphohydrolase
MTTMLDDIKAFHEKFDLTPAPEPQFLDRDTMLFRLNFLHEELSELATAIHEQDLTEVLDALVDIVYVALGTAYLMDLPFADAWDEVHASNMAKVRAVHESESKRGSKADVIKPPGWAPPDLQAVVWQYWLKKLGGTNV